MKRKSSPRVIAGKNYRVTFGVNQAEMVNKAANKANQSPRQFLHDATMDACETAGKLPERR